ncbi:MAG: hypothetical protein WDZ29_06150 [Balneolaceae bacterium]
MTSVSAAWFGPAARRTSRTSDGRSECWQAAEPDQREAVLAEHPSGSQLFDRLQIEIPDILVERWIADPDDFVVAVKEKR